MKHRKLSMVMFCIFAHGLHGTNISIIGCGYVGLVTAVCLANLGHNIISTDIDENKIKLLQQAQIPFFEPGLQELLLQVITKEKIKFTSNIADAIKTTDVIYITVGTPFSNGKTDLTAIESAIDVIGRNLTQYKLIIIKSTLPVGAVSKMQKKLEKQFDLFPIKDFDFVSCPEFLREGSAIDDFFNPNRLVWGIESDNPINKLHEIYDFFIRKKIPLVITNHKSASLIKYASNAFLAVKISFINEIANLCDSLGINISDIQKGLSFDPRIGSSYLKPGPGYGGSCLPKDTAELCKFGQENDVNLHVIEAACKTNVLQARKPFFQLKKLFNGNLEGKTVSILGLSFKPETDDIRYSPALAIIDMLIENGAIIKAYDPVANANMQKVFPHVHYCSSMKEALLESNGVIILTDWNEFKNIDLDDLIIYMADPVIVDARNILDITQLKTRNIAWKNIGENSIIGLVENLIQ